MNYRKKTNLHLLGWSSLVVGALFLPFELIAILRPGLVSKAFALILLWPGAFADAALSLIFSQYGGHGQILPYWLADALSWATYSFIVYLVLAFWKRVRTETVVPPRNSV